jgi:hypothetical protein
LRYSSHSSHSSNQVFHTHIVGAQFQTRRLTTRYWATQSKICGGHVRFDIQRNRPDAQTLQNPCTPSSLPLNPSHLISSLQHENSILTRKKKGAIVSAIVFGILLLFGLLITSGCLYWWSREKKEAASKAQVENGGSSVKVMEEELVDKPEEQTMGMEMGVLTSA